MIRAVLLIAASTALFACKTTDDAMQTLSDFGFPTPNQSSESGTGTKIAGGLTGCAVGGAAGYFGTKALSSKLEEQGYSADDVKKAAVVVGSMGCIVGGRIALEIIANMDEKSKRAQEQAWEAAQAQTETVQTSAPQAWSTDTHEGTVSIINPQESPQGQQCATRRNFVKTSEGEAEQFIPVCKNNAGVYEQVEA